MEDSGKALGGGPPTDEQQAELEALADLSCMAVVDALQAQAPVGVQAAPSPRQLDEGDHMKYQLLGERVEKSELKMAMYQRELQHAQIERARHVHELSQHVRHIEQKYSTNLSENMVTEDGYIIARSDVRRG